ncbi:MAG: hypothetical protein J6V50_04475 [Clostridia bacterium]|nr:hypothetical protein [Clostridia bacterium]
MLKLFGSLLIVVVSAAFGLRASFSLKERKEKLSEFILLIDEIEDMIRQGAALEIIYKSERAKRLLNVSGYLASPKEEGLKTGDVKLLSEFFSKLGMGDSKSALTLCEDYGKIVGKKFSESEKQVGEKAKLYSLLGVFFGIFIAILLV